MAELALFLELVAHHAEGIVQRRVRQRVRQSGNRAVRHGAVQKVRNDVTVKDGQRLRREVYKETKSERATESENKSESDGPGCCTATTATPLASVFLSPLASRHRPVDEY